MSVYAFGPFQLKEERLSLTRDGEPVELGRKVVETLLALVERPGEVLAKGVLLDRIWPEGFVEEANLAQNIYVLRKTFRSHGSADPIETVPRHGYRFTAPVCRLADAALVRPFADGSPARVPVIPKLDLQIPAAGHVRPALPRRFVAALACAAFVAASLVLVASHGLGHRSSPRALSDNGARLYQIGRYYWNQRTRDGVRKSLGYFARVIDADPRDARGYAALADANVTMGDYCYGTHRPAAYFARAGAYAKKALALDPNSAEAHAALGFLALHRNNRTDAVAELQLAIALDPSYGPAHEWFGIALVERGNLAGGRHQLKLAAELDPLSVATLAWLGSAAYLDRRFDDAIAYSRQALELSPQRTDALRMIGDAYESQGDINRAIEAFRRYGAVDPYYRAGAAALLAHAYALGHRMPEARAQLGYALAHATDVDPTKLAAAVAAVGDPSVAPDTLRRVHGHASSTAVEDAARFEALQGPAELRQLPQRPT